MVTWHLAELSLRMISVPLPTITPTLQMKTLRPGRLGNKPKTTEPEGSRAACLSQDPQVMCSATSVAVTGLFSLLVAAGRGV